MTSTPRYTESRDDVEQKNAKPTHIKCQLCPTWQKLQAFPTLQRTPCPLCAGSGTGLRTAHIELTVLDPGFEGFDDITSVKELEEWYEFVTQIRERHAAAHLKLQVLHLVSDLNEAHSKTQLKNKAKNEPKKTTGHDDAPEISGSDDTDTH